MIPPSPARAQRKARRQSKSSHERCRDCWLQLLKRATPPGPNAGTGGRLVGGHQSQLGERADLRLVRQGDFSRPAQCTGNAWPPQTLSNPRARSPVSRLRIKHLPPWGAGCSCKQVAVHGCRPWLAVPHAPTPAPSSSTRRPAKSCGFAAKYRQSGSACGIAACT